MSKTNKTHVIIILSIIIIMISAVKVVAYPRIQKIDLPNGMRLLLMEYDALPLVHFYVAIKPGSVADPPGLEGLAYLTIRTLKKGTKRLSGTTLTDAFDFVGATYVAGINPDYGYIHVECLKENFLGILQILGELLTSPTFPSNEVDLEKQHIIDSLLRVKETPSLLANESIKYVLFKGSPYGIFPRGTWKSLNRIKLTDVKTFFKDYYVPKNMTMVLVGDFNTRVELPKIKKIIGAIPSRKRKKIKSIKKPRVPRGKYYLVDQGKTTQVQIRFGAPGIKVNHPQLFPLKVVNGILGGGFTSKLTRILREKSGLTYDARSYTIHFRSTGGIIISTHTKNKNLDKVVVKVRETLNEMVKKGVSKDEVEKTKNYLTGIFPIRMQRIENLAQAIAYIDIYNLNKNYLETYHDNIRKVSRRKINKVLKKYFIPEYFNIIVVGNGKELLPVLKKWGDVVLLNMNELEDIDK